MHNPKHFNQTVSDPVNDDVIGVNNNFTRTRYSACPEKIGVLCGMLKIVLYPIKEAVCGVLIVLTDGIQNFL